MGISLPEVVRLAAIFAATMRTLALFLSMSCLAACATTSAAGNRTSDDVARDTRDHTSEVLGLLQLAPGMTVLDVFGGGGYFSELAAGAVGANGHVRLINNPPYDKYSKKDLSVRLANNRLPTVTYEVSPPADMKLGTATADVALLVMSYHDLYVADPADGWPAIDASQFIDQIVAALKPGGRLLIIDHQAKLGTGNADAQKLHRIEAAFATTDFTAHGLKLERTLDVLHRDDDPHELNVFDKAIRGKTDRFVHVYRKPE